MVVYPRVEPLPRWRLPAATIEGARSTPERTHHATPLVSSVRPYAPGDPMNRIHWPTTVRQGEIQVKEFELERTADLWIVLDLDRAWQEGRGELSSVEVAVRVAAAIADRALRENRAVGITVNGHHLSQLPSDRGARQRLKILQLLAAVDGDGTATLAEALVRVNPRIRQGMTAVVITGSDDPSWVRPLAALRGKGVASVAVALEMPAFRRAHEQDRIAHGQDVAPEDPALAAAAAQRRRSLLHTLTEFQVRTHTVVPERPLGEQLVS
jgi:uncharacterized protein (DUF58 family)